MRRGATAMVMFADFDKYNGSIKNAKQLRVRRIYGNIVVSSLKDVISYTRFFTANNYLKVVSAQYMLKHLFQEIIMEV